jgi:hypothetical protein
MSGYVAYIEEACMQDFSGKARRKETIRKTQQ